MALIPIFLVTKFVNSKKNGLIWFPSHHDCHYLVLHVNLKVFQFINYGQLPLDKNAWCLL